MKKISRLWLKIIKTLVRELEAIFTASIGTISNYLTVNEKINMTKKCVPFKLNEEQKLDPQRHVLVTFNGVKLIQFKIRLL